MRAEPDPADSDRTRTAMEEFSGGFAVRGDVLFEESIMPSIRPHEMLSEAWNEIEEPRRKEIASLVLFVTAVILALALVSYDPSDVAGAAGSRADGTGTHNWIGKPGGYVAHGCFTLFGWLGFLLPLVIGYIGHLHFRGRWDQRIRWPEYLGIVIVLTSVCALLAIIRMLTAEAQTSTAAWNAGGAIGFFLANRLLTLGNVGAIVVDLAALAVGLLLATPLLISDCFRGAVHTVNRWRTPFDEEETEEDLETLMPLETAPTIRTTLDEDRFTLPPLRTIDEIERHPGAEEPESPPTPKKPLKKQ
ncbi:hypothetical protein DRN32_06470, partial [Thermococci archaeon]